MDEFDFNNEAICKIKSFEHEQLSLARELIASFNADIISRGFTEEVYLEFNDSIRNRPQMDIGYECAINYTVKRNDSVFSTKWPIVRINENRKAVLFKISSDEIESDVAADILEQIECVQENQDTSLPMLTKQKWMSKPYKTYNKKEKKLFWLFIIIVALFPIVIIIACMLPSMAAYLVIGELLLLCIATILAKVAGIL